MWVFDIAVPLYVPKIMGIFNCWVFSICAAGFILSDVIPVLANPLFILSKVTIFGLGIILVYFYYFYFIHNYWHYVLPNFTIIIPHWIYIPCSNFYLPWYFPSLPYFCGSSLISLLCMSICDEILAVYNCWAISIYLNPIFVAPNIYFEFFFGIILFFFSHDLCFNFIGFVLK